MMKVRLRAFLSGLVVIELCGQSGSRAYLSYSRIRPSHDSNSDPEYMYRKQIGVGLGYTGTVELGNSKVVTV